MDALEAFEDLMRKHRIRGAMPEYFLRKLEAHDPSNPEYLDKLVDNDWQMFRAGYLACKEAR